MNKNIKSIFFVLTVIILLCAVGAVSATDDTSNRISDITTSADTSSDSAITELQTTHNEKQVDIKSIEKENKNTKTESKTIILNNQTFNTYITDKTFNDNVSDGDVIDAQGLFYGQEYSLTINKAVNFTSTTNDANFSTDRGLFSMNDTASGSNITNINIYNTQVILSGISNVNINNITMTIETGGIGKGQGGFSVRNGAFNVTLTNSYFKTNNNGGVSSMVLAGASNFLFENNTIEAIGNVGNLFYLTTYNAPDGTDNGNTIIRNNYINANQANVQPICYGIGLAGKNIIIENNVIEYGGFCVSPQWGQGTQANITFINNTIPYGSASLGYEGSVAINNTITNVGTLGEAYNNTFGRATLSQTSNFSGNKVENLTVSANNINITNDNEIKNLIITGSNNIISNLVLDSLTIEGNNNTLSNITVPFITIKGNENTITQSTVNSSSEYAIEITGSSNRLTNNTLYSSNKIGNNAIYSSNSNTIENNLPESLTFTITDDNYNQYFDENGYPIESILKQKSTLIFSGEFYNKNFNFNNNLYTIDGNNSILHGSRLTFNDSIITLSNLKINNTDYNINNSIFINNGTIKISYVEIENNAENTEEIIINANNTEFNRNTINIQGTGNVTALKINQNGSNTLNNNLINISGNNVIGINITGETINNIMNNNKIIINADDAIGMIIAGDNLLNNRIEFINITINAEREGKGIIFDDNESLMNTYFNVPRIRINAENITIMKINPQNNYCDNTTVSGGEFDGNGSNVIGTHIIGNNTQISQPYSYMNATESLRVMMISGERINSRRNSLFNPMGAINGSNTEDNLTRSVYLTLENFINFNYEFPNTLNLNNCTTCMLINGSLNNMGGFSVNRKDKNATDFILINETNTTISSSINTNNPITIINSTNIKIKNMQFNNDTTININNSINTTFESNTMNNEFKVTESNSTSIYKQNTINSNITIESENSEIISNNIKATITTINSKNINIYNNTINTTNEYTVKLINTTNSCVTKNYLYALDKEGDSSVNNEETTNTVKDNSPYSIILTDDNYNQYFDENSEIISKAPTINIQLGSNLYNKDLTFTENTIFTNPNNYTIYNGTISNTGTMTIQNTIINNTNNKITSIYSNNQIELINNTIYVEGNNKEVMKLENYSGSNTNIQNNIIIANGDNNIVIKANNYTIANNKFTNNNITSNGEKNNIIYFANQTGTNYIQKNNIQVNTNEAITEILIDNARVYFNNNNITVNTTQNEIPIVQVNNNTQGQVNNNYLESSDLIGNAAVDTPGTKSGNTPIPTLILTDENYDTYFQNNTLIDDRIERIYLESNLQNKNMTFNNYIEFYGNNNTIYNGTITLTDTTTKTIKDIIINNTDQRTSSIIINNSPISLNNSVIYQSGNNKQAVILEQYTNTLSYFQNNNITVVGDNNIAIKANNYTIANNKFRNNNITSYGENNTAIYYANTTSTSYLVSNNITVKSSSASTPVIIDNAGIYFMNNNLISNTTQGETPLVKVITTTNGRVNNNYIESLDLVGNDAVNTPGTKSGNKPTTTGYNAIINIEEKTLTILTENTITINVTDSFNRIIEGIVTVTINEETIDLTDNHITITPNNTNDITIKVTYTDPTGKYNTITKNKTLTVTPITLTLNPITAKIGDTINITARITADDETINSINTGKITFKVNGKTLKNANGKVIYAKVINGTATIENYTVPQDWAKEGTTIEAVYSGSTQCEKLTSEKTNITIQKAVPTLTTESINTTADSTITLTATITDNDKTINSGKIVFKINGKTVKDANGKVIYAKVVNNTVSVEYTIPESMKAGNYTITATYVGSGYDKLEASETLIIT